MSELLPDGAYLAWRYDDRQRGESHGRVYFGDGRIEAVDRDGAEELCRFDAEQLAAARAAVAELSAAPAEPPGPPAFDAARVEYAWSLDGRRGELVYAYPPEPAAIEALEQRLTALEEAAGGWPLLADE